MGNNALRAAGDCATIVKTQCEVIVMNTATTIKELRESIKMTRKEFSEHTGIPVRTLEDWEAGRRTPPAPGNRRFSQKSPAGRLI